MDFYRELLSSEKVTASDTVNSNKIYSKVGTLFEVLLRVPFAKLVRAFHVCVKFMRVTTHFWLYPSRDKNVRMNSFEFTRAPTCIYRSVTYFLCTSTFIQSPHLPNYYSDPADDISCQSLIPLTFKTVTPCLTTYSYIKVCNYVLRTWRCIQVTFHVVTSNPCQMT